MRGGTGKEGKPLSLGPLLTKSGHKYRKQVVYQRSQFCLGFLAYYGCLYYYYYGWSIYQL